MFWTPGSSLSKSLTGVFTSVRLFLVSQLGEVMVSMASNLTLADERVLWMAQREALACSRIIACLQKIAVYRLATEQAFFLVSQRHWPYFFFFFGSAATSVSGAPTVWCFHPHTVCVPACRCSCMD